MNPENI
jgi:hypothetical protein